MPSSNLLHKHRQHCMQCKGKRMTMINKDHLYGLFNGSIERRARLHEMALAKAMDLPLSEGINVTNTANSSNPGLIKTALVCAALLLGGSAATVGAGSLFGWFGMPETPTLEPQEYEVQFWAEDGTEINVEPRKENL